MNKSRDAFRIRLSQLRDQKGICRLLSMFMLPQERLANTKMWVLQDNDGNIVGTAGLEVWREKGLLRSVAISQNLHNRGLGTCLVKYVINEARKSRINELFLFTEKAEAFFRKVGFKKDNVAHVSGAIRNSEEFKGACPESAILMRLKL